MRVVALGLAATLFAGDAIAADYLRGSTFDEPPAPNYRWSGWYGGGQIGYANTDFDFSKGTRDLVGDMVRQLLVETEAHISTLPKLTRGDARAMSYGAFVGYNGQWGEVVLGVEANYNHTSLIAGSTDSIGRSFVTSDNFRNDVLVTSSASAKLTDYGTIRGRAGYAMGWLMPYGTVGLAVGRADYQRSARVQINQTDVSPAALDLTDGIAPRPGGSLDATKTDNKNGAYTFGYALGLGLDVGLTQNLFMRGEWEFIQFNPIGGIALHVNTFRVGAGLKF